MKLNIRQKKHFFCTGKQSCHLLMYLSLMVILPLSLISYILVKRADDKIG